jgi:hypothetical protein
MTRKVIPISRPVFAENEKKYVNECLDDVWISSSRIAWEGTMLLDGDYDPPTLREQLVIDAVGAAGYFRRATAIVESHAVFRGTRIWALAHVSTDAAIGKDCTVCDDTLIESDVRISWEIASGAAAKMPETSLYPTRKLSALGDGGAILAHDEAWAGRARTLCETRGSRRYPQQN